MPRRKTPTQSGLHKTFRGHYTHFPSQYKGYHSDDVQYRLPRSYATPDRRRTQFLNHLATVLKGHYDSLKNRSEIEIQVALIDGGRWLIAANDDTTTEYFFGRLVDQTVGRVGLKLKVMATELERKLEKSTANDVFRKRRHAKKLKSELHGLRRGLADETLRNEISGFYSAGNDAAIALDAVDGDSRTIVDFCTGALVGKTIALVSAPGKNWHAEQKILYALVRASTLGNLSITFSGTFRPCRGCFETLQVVKKYYMPNLRFGDYPGRYWKTTGQCHIEIINLLKRQGRVNDDTFGTDFSDSLLNDPVTITYQPRLRLSGQSLVDELHYNSESESDFDDDDWEVSDD